MTELMYLTDARSKEKVYFTQGHGELRHGASAANQRDRRRAIVRYLRDRKVTVEPLTFERDRTPKVPDDAARRRHRRAAADDSPKAMPMLAAPSPTYPKQAGQDARVPAGIRAAQGRSPRPGWNRSCRDFGVDVDAQTGICQCPESV